MLQALVKCEIKTIGENYTKFYYIEQVLNMFSKAKTKVVVISFGSKEVYDKLLLFLNKNKKHKIHFSPGSRDLAEGDHLSIGNVFGS